LPAAAVTPAAIDERRPRPRLGRAHL